MSFPVFRSATVYLVRRFRNSCSLPIGVSWRFLLILVCANLYKVMYVQRCRRVVDEERDIGQERSGLEKSELKVK